MWSVIVTRSVCWGEHSLRWFTSPVQPSRYQRPFEGTPDKSKRVLSREWPSNRYSLQWIIDHFTVPDDIIHDDDFPAKEEWISMRYNKELKIKLQEQGSDSFWISQHDSPTLAKGALELLVSFSTTYLCEKGFSTVMGMKSKRRIRMNVENDARLSLSTTKLAAEMQLQPSNWVSVTVLMIIQ